VVVEDVIAALVTALGLATLIALYLGLLGIAGALQWTRCERCGHLVVTATSTALSACAYCSHERLLHPLHTIRHPHDPSQFQADRARGH
jgi:DNA-directed RNA polymerase subunit RPC12/RpoP